MVHGLVFFFIFFYSCFYCSQQRSWTFSVKMLFECSTTSFRDHVFRGFQANARCHKPVDPNLWWLAAQARIYRYVSARQTQRLIQTKLHSHVMRWLITALSRHSLPNSAHVSALYAITPPIVGGPGALIPLAEWRHCIKAAGLPHILSCVGALTGNARDSSAISADAGVAWPSIRPLPWVFRRLR